MPVGSAATTGAARARAPFAGRRRFMAPAVAGSEGGQRLGQLRRAAMWTLRSLPFRGANQDLAALPALPAVKFVNRHGGKVVERRGISMPEPARTGKAVHPKVPGGGRARVSSPRRRAEPYPRRRTEDSNPLAFGDGRGELTLFARTHENAQEPGFHNLLNANHDIDESVGSTHPRARRLMMEETVFCSASGSSFSVGFGKLWPARQWR